MRMRFLVPFAFAALAACSGGGGGPKIDASSPDKMQTSVAEIRKGLPADKAAQFDTALVVVTFSSLDMADMFSGDTVAMQKKMQDAFHGLTADQVIAKAEKIQKEEGAKQQ